MYFSIPYVDVMFHAILALQRSTILLDYLLSLCRTFLMETKFLRMVLAMLKGVVIRLALEGNS